MYDSDDSVKDPDFIYNLFQNEKSCPFFTHEDETDSDLDFSAPVEKFQAPVEKIQETTELSSLQASPSTHKNVTDSDLNFSAPIERTTELPSLPAPRPAVYIATPDGIIFKDHDQANCFRKNTQTADFIAMYPEPIYLNQATHETSNFLTETQQLSDNNAETRSKKNTERANKKKLKYPLIDETCGEKCKRQCHLFTLEERKIIWDNYWNMDIESRRSFLNKCTKIQAVKRRKVTVAEKNPNPKYAKNESRFFYLPKINGSDGMMEELNVCRKFFLKTLGHKTDAVITELSRGIKRNVLYGDVTEKRGGKKRRLDRDPITNHILSFNPTVSHYRRNNAPLARYLPRTLTLHAMFSDFKKKFPNSTCSKEVYRQTIKRMHISFKFPRGDKCTDCESFEQEIGQHEDANVPETLKTAYEGHKIKANKAIQQYQDDASKENTTSVRYYSMDLQKVMLLPDMPKVKDSFFLSRLIAFNLTFAPVQKSTNVNSTCVLWHEAWAGRDANNIVDAFATLLEKQRDLHHLVIWCDNCTSQNKNWILYTALVTLVNSQFSSIQTINLKYLTKGHTHMTADGVHGNIESQIKRREAVYDYEDYKDAVQGCRQNIEVLEVQKKYQWIKKKRTPRRNNPNDVLNTFALNSVVDVKFVSGSRKIFFKMDFDDSYSELDFLVKKFNEGLLPDSNTSPRGIKQSKKDGILSKLVPSNRRQFWLQLPVCDESEDLVSGGQMITD